MRYYKYLFVYDFVLFGMIDSIVKVGVINGQQDKVKLVLVFIFVELVSWEDLKNNMM